MGYGDEIMATGMARGARDRGVRIAFGDRKRIVFGPWSEEMFRHNPNIAAPGDEGSPDLEWIAHYKGSRLYNRVSGNRWKWNYSFRAQPGEMFFSATERQYASRYEPGFVVIEPNVPWKKSVAPNKNWGLAKYQIVASNLLASGVRVRQFSHGRDKLRGVELITVPDFRHALAVLERAAAVIAPEGGLHHGAAAVGRPAVVLFGGFIPPEVTGYEMHTNLTGGATACGSITRCTHCQNAMGKIKVDEVLTAVQRYIQ